MKKTTDILIKGENMNVLSGNLERLIQAGRTDISLIQAKEEHDCAMFSRIVNVVKKV